MGLVTAGRGMVAAAVALTLVGATQATGAAPDAGVSTASAGVTLPTLSVDASSATSGALGTIGALATGGTNPVARLKVGGLSALGKELPGFAVSSGSPQSHGDASVPLSAGPVDGGVHLQSWQVDADARSAAATVAGGTADVGALALETGLSVSGDGIHSRVSPDGTDAGLAVDAVGLKLTLGDLLPPGMLDKLPLSVLLTLAHSLGAATQAGTVQTTLQTLADRMSAADDVLGQLSDAVTKRDALFAAAGGTDAVAAVQDAKKAVADLQQKVTADQQAVASAQTAVQQAADAVLAAGGSLTGTTGTSSGTGGTTSGTTGTVTGTTGTVTGTVGTTVGTVGGTLGSLTAHATTDLSTLQAAYDAAMATLGSAQATLTADQQALATAQATLDAAVATAQQLASSTADPALKAATDLVTSLAGRLQTLLGKVQTSLAGLPNLATLRAALRDALTDTPLVQIGALRLSVSASAQPAYGFASATCQVGSLVLLGQQLPVTGCDEVGALVKQASDTVGAVFRGLPLAGAVPTFALDGLAVRTSGTSTPNADGSVDSTAEITPLKLVIGKASLGAAPDLLVATLADATGSLLADLPQVSALTAAGRLLTAHAAGTTTPTLADLLSTLGGQLSALPSGTDLSGLSTTGVRATFGALTATAHYVPAAAPPQGGGAPAQAGSTGTPTMGGHPATGTPQQPGTPAQAPGTTAAGPTGSLPYTGSDSAALLAAALLLAVGGVHLVLVGTRRRTPHPAGL